MNTMEELIEKYKQLKDAGESPVVEVSVQWNSIALLTEAPEESGERSIQHAEVIVSRFLKAFLKEEGIEYWDFDEKKANVNWEKRKAV